NSWRTGKSRAQPSRKDVSVHVPPGKTPLPSICVLRVVTHPDGSRRERESQGEGCRSILALRDVSGDGEPRTTQAARAFSILVVGARDGPASLHGKAER